MSGNTQFIFRPINKYTYLLNRTVLCPHEGDSELGGGGEGDGRQRGVREHHRCHGNSGDNSCYLLLRQLAVVHAQQVLIADHLYRHKLHSESSNKCEKLLVDNGQRQQLITKIVVI